MRKDLLKGLTEEQLLKARNCKDEAELLKLAQEEGLELSEEQLEAVSGGCNLTAPEKISKCPICGAEVTGEWVDASEGDVYTFVCPHCGYAWKE